MSHSLRAAHRFDEFIVLDAACYESYLGTGGEQSPISTPPGPGHHRQRPVRANRLFNSLSYMRYLINLYFVSMNRRGEAIERRWSVPF